MSTSYRLDLTICGRVEQSVRDSDRGVPLTSRAVQRFVMVVRVDPGDVRVQLGRVLVVGQPRRAGRIATGPLSVEELLGLAQGPHA
jgi:hypothetical protein